MLADITPLLVALWGALNNLSRILLVDELLDTRDFARRNLELHSC